MGVPLPTHLSGFPKKPHQAAQAEADFCPEDHCHFRILIQGKKKSIFLLTWTFSLNLKRKALKTQLVAGTHPL
jgi:hypothetical protein